MTPTISSPTQSGRQFTDLNKAIDGAQTEAGNGALRLEPDAAAKAARACAQLLEGLELSLIHI